jgi:hypothetical protein
VEFRQRRKQRTRMMLERVLLAERKKSEKATKRTNCQKALRFLFRFVLQSPSPKKPTKKNNNRKVVVSNFFGCSLSGALSKLFFVLCSREKKRKRRNPKNKPVACSVVNSLR